MASIIRIKRSGNSGSPTTLGLGELAYSYKSGDLNNGGDRLYVGAGGVDGNGDALDIAVIGGKYFTDKLDHAPGTLTANSAILVDSNKKIDELSVDNLKLDGNTLSSTNSNGNIFITPAGSGKTVVSNLFIGDDQTSLEDFVGTISISGIDIVGTAGEIGVVSDTVNDTVEFTIGLENSGVDANTYGSASSIPVITVDSKGRITGVTTESVATNLSIEGNSGSVTVDLLSDTLDVVGSGAISVEAGVVGGDPRLTISAVDAGTTTKGVASFNTNNFTVSNGAVSTKDITLGTSTLTLGSTIQSIEGLTSLEVDNIRIDENIISAINSEEVNVNIELQPKGDGTVNVGFSRITSVGDPTTSSDAANKAYVDAVAQGLKIRTSAWVLVDQPLSANYDPDGFGDGWATLEATANGAFPTIDDIDSSELNVEGARILLTAQANAAHNGLYVLASEGDATSRWQLRRCGTCRTNEQIPGSFVFVKYGTAYANTGWVANVDDISTFEIGVDSIEWTQFSGAGTFVAGDGLVLTGNVFSVADTLSGKTINNSNIGVVNPGTGSFTTLTASGVTTFTNTTQASSLSTASVVMSGGLAVVKDLRLGGNIVGNGTNELQGFVVDGGEY